MEDFEEVFESGAADAAPVQQLDDHDAKIVIEEAGVVAVVGEKQRADSSVSELGIVLATAAAETDTAGSNNNNQQKEPPLPTANPTAIDPNHHTPLHIPPVEPPVVPERTGPSSAPIDAPPLPQQPPPPPPPVDDDDFGDFDDFESAAAPAASLEAQQQLPPVAAAASHIPPSLSSASSPSVSSPAQASSLAGQSLVSASDLAGAQQLVQLILSQSSIATSSLFTSEIEFFYSKHIPKSSGTSDINNNNSIVVGSGIESLLVEENDDITTTSSGFSYGSSNNPMSDFSISTATAAAATKPKLIIPNPYFGQQSWHAFWKQLASETTYSDSICTRFRWKRSLTRKIFLESLDMNSEDATPTKSLQNGTATTATTTARSSSLTRAMNGPAVSAVSGNTSGGGLGSPALSPVDANHHDSREFEFAEAKRLSEIPEEELYMKSNEELTQMMQQLTNLTHKIQEQAAFWLDAKEQLLMDAEMHNKMIASLVQYAQQQQIKGPSAAKKLQANKKGAVRRR